MARRTTEDEPTTAEHRCPAGVRLRCAGESLRYWHCLALLQIPDHTPAQSALNAAVYHSRYDRARS